MTHTIKIGHRGAMGHAPENTITSFKKAIELKVDAIELDVQLCKSGELIVIHDEKIDRTTDGKGYVREKTFNELKSVKIKNNERIPLLSEVLDVIKRRVRVDIELKGTNVAKAVSELIEKYIREKGWKYKDFIVSSFNHYELKRFHEINPNVETCALIDGLPIGFAEFAEKAHAHSIGISLESITKEFVDDAHRRGLKVYVWVVNDPDDISRMKAMGVDGIFSDYPERI